MDRTRGALDPDGPDVARAQRSGHRLVGRRRGRTLARRLLPPLAALVLVRLLLALAAVRSGSPAWATAHWAHWDSALYLEIATGGYTLEPCASGYPAGSWCGNAGWFPAYPAAIRLVSAAGLAPVAAAVLVSAVATAGLLLLLWVRFLHARLAPGPLLLLLLAAFFPGSIYQSAAFPIALFVLFVLGHLDALQHRRWVLAGLLAALAASTYPLGVVLPVTGALGAAVVVAGPARQRLRAAAVVGGLAAAGALAVAVRLQLSVGRWDAYLLVQDKYGHGVNSPLETLRSTLQPLVGAAGFTAETAARWQTLLVATIVALGLGATVGAVLRRHPGAAEAVPTALFVAVVWLMPLVVGSGVSLYRSEAALVPAVILLRRLPREIVAVLLALALPAAYVLAQLFFADRLV